MPVQILMFSWEYPPRVVGGVSRHVQGLSRALVKLGHEVTVLTAQGSTLPDGEARARSSGPLPEAAAAHQEGPAATPEKGGEQDQGVRVVRVGDGYPPARDFYTSILQFNFSLLKAALRLSPEDYQILHAHDWLVAYAARTVKHAWHRPLVATFHATEYGRNGGLHTDLQRQISDVEWWLGYEAWRVVACSQHMRQELGWVFQLPDDKIRVIPNGVHPEDFQPWPKESPEWWQFRRRFARDDEKLLLFIGRLVNEKGAGTLVEAMPKITTYVPRARAVVAGEGPERQRLQERAHDLYMEKQVSFLGFVDDATRNRLLAVADVAVFPSTYEPFGIVALEAMASRTPVVVADAGGFREIIQHGVNGLKAYPGNADSLANNVLTLLHDPELARDLAQEAWADVVQHYSWQRVAGQTAAVYEQVWEEFMASPWGQEPAGAGRSPEEQFVGQVEEFFRRMSTAHARPSPQRHAERLPWDQGSVAADSTAPDARKTAGGASPWPQ